MPDELSLRVEVALPDWVPSHVQDWPPPETDDEAMSLVAGLAMRNVERSTGGPFAAAVYRRSERARRELVSVGVNVVTPAVNSCAHAEVVAIMLAQRAMGCAPLAEPRTLFEMFTSCEPCAMCLGAVLWSGVKRLVCGARREDAEEIGFVEGPVFPASYRYLQDHGVEVLRDVRRAACVQAFEAYRRRQGAIYNG